MSALLYEMLTHEALRLMHGCFYLHNIWSVDKNSDKMSTYLRKLDDCWESRKLTNTGKRISFYSLRLRTQILIHPLSTFFHNKIQLTRRGLLKGDLFFTYKAVYLGSDCLQKFWNPFQIQQRYVHDSKWEPRKLWHKYWIGYLQSLQQL